MLGLPVLEQLDPEHQFKTDLGRLLGRSAAEGRAAMISQPLEIHTPRDRLSSVAFLEDAGFGGTSGAPE